MNIYEPDVITITDSGSLPKNDCWMVAYFPDQPWGANDAPNDEFHWVVVHFQRGITKDQRDSLSKGHPRKTAWKSYDELDNNRRPWGFTEFGPGSFFGQEATHYFLLPTLSEIPS